MNVYSKANSSHKTAHIHVGKSGEEFSMLHNMKVLGSFCCGMCLGTFMRMEFSETR